MPLSVLLLHFSWASLGVDGYVIHIDGKPPLGDLFVEDCVHHHLDGRRQIGEAIEHDCWFEQPLGCEECGLPFISRLDPDAVIPPSDVEFREEGAPAKAVDSLGNERGDIAVFLSPFIHGSVVLDQVKLPILLFYKEESWQHRGSTIHGLSPASSVRPRTCGPPRSRLVLTEGDSLEGNLVLLVRVRWHDPTRCVLATAGSPPH